VRAGLKVLILRMMLASVLRGNRQGTLCMRGGGWQGVGEGGEGYVRWHKGVCGHLRTRGVKVRREGE
jgi:hypothetical protein